MRISKRFHGLSRPAPGLGIVLVLASLTLVTGRAQASDVRVEARIGIGDGHPQGGFEQLVPVPIDGLQVDLWSDPDPGAYLSPGDPVNLYFRANADCYVTIVSIGTNGRASRLFPLGRDDGWVYGDEVCRLPDPRAGYTLRASGPAGEERVVAFASLAPMYDRYPAWLAAGWGPESCPTRGLSGTGWLGDGFMLEVGGLCGLLVPWPDRYDTYDCSWISFRVGSWRAPEHRCGLCYRPLYDHRCSCGGSSITIRWSGRFHYDHRDRCVVSGPEPRGRWHNPGHDGRDGNWDRDGKRKWSRGNQADVQDEGRDRSDRRDHSRQGGSRDYASDDGKARKRGANDRESGHDRDRIERKDDRERENERGSERAPGSDRNRKPRVEGRDSSGRHLDDRGRDAEKDTRSGPSGNRSDEQGKEPKKDGKNDPKKKGPGNQNLGPRGRDEGRSRTR